MPKIDLIVCGGTYPSYTVSVDVSDAWLDLNYGKANTTVIGQTTDGIWFEVSDIEVDSSGNYYSNNWCMIRHANPRKEVA